jgi:hypothetical protein
MANSINEQAREDLKLAMEVINVEVGGVVLPLLNSSVGEILLIINKNGEVEEIRPLYKLKK